MLTRPERLTRGTKKNWQPENTGKIGSNTTITWAQRLWLVFLNLPTFLVSCHQFKFQIHYILFNLCTFSSKHNFIANQHIGLVYKKYILWKQKESWDVYLEKNLAKRSFKQLLTHGVSQYPTLYLTPKAPDRKWPEP